MIDLKALRAKFIDLAIRGKLVEQRPEEGTAEELYTQIQDEKARLIKEKKLKKEKPLPPISDEEIPFEIPESWKWCRLVHLSSEIGDGLHGTPFYDLAGSISFINGNNLRNGRIVLTSNTKKVSEEEAQKYRKNLVNSSILVSINGTLGNVALYDGEDIILGKSVCYCNLLKDISNLYIKYLIDSAYFQRYLVESATGTTIRNVPLKAMRAILIPLPPLSEQKRIVEKLEAVLSVIDKAEDLLERKKELNKKIREKILQMAISGRLVEQRPEEGTAEELYTQIQEEKARLIKEKKLKKEKPLPPISDDEIPFEIPESWKWVYIGDLFQHNTGKALNSSNKKEGSELEYITTSNVYWNSFKLDNLKRMFFKVEERSKCTVEKGDLLVCEGGDFGRAAIWNFERNVCIQNHIHRLRAYTELEIKFYYYVFFILKNSGLISGKGIGLQGLSSNALHILKVPLPPLSEQKRIVTKIEELFALCDDLK